jgi:CheY-like chemotaxis protein
VSRCARILVVDDNRTLRLLISQALEHAGYVAIGADSAETALEVARTDPPDLLLVDQVMPGMSGAELIRSVRADPTLRTRTVIGFSGVSNAAEELLRAGADLALQKPLHEEELLGQVRRMLAAGEHPH